MMLALCCALLFLAALGKALNTSPVSAALKAGLGFFGSMTLVCVGGYLWLIRRPPIQTELMVGQRLVTTRMHLEVSVFRASHCLYFAAVTDAVAYRKALSGLVVGTHVFYLADGAYLTEAGVHLTMGMHPSRSAVVFMRAFKAYVLMRTPSVNTAFD